MRIIVKLVNIKVIKGIWKVLSRQELFSRPYEVQVFSGTIYSKWLKLLQIIYESSGCDSTTQEFYDSWFQ